MEKEKKNDSMKYQLHINTADVFCFVFVVVFFFFFGGETIMGASLVSPRTKNISTPKKKTK